MKMKLAALLLATLVVPSFAAKNLKMLKDGTPAFTMEVISQIGDVKPGQYASFCIEHAEQFNYTSYYGVMNENYQAMSGGNVWSDGLGSTVVASGGTDALDYSSAWLFTQFSTGNSKYQDQAALQNAIWYIEAEFNTGEMYNAEWADSSTTWKKYVADAVAANNTTYGNVRVLNLWKDYNENTGVYSGFAQDQIVFVPAPGAIMLASMGMGLVGYLRRRHSI